MALETSIWCTITWKDIRQYQQVFYRGVGLRLEVSSVLAPKVKSKLPVCQQWFSYLVCASAFSLERCDLLLKNDKLCLCFDIIQRVSKNVHILRRGRKTVLKL